METPIFEDIPSTKDEIRRDDSIEPILGNADDDQEQPSSSNQPVLNQTAVERVKSTNTYRLEVPVLLLFFSWNLSGTVFQNQVLYQSCLLNYNQTICDQLTVDIPDALVVILTSFTHCIWNRLLKLTSFAL